MKRQLIVTLETVTPMFLAGADPRGEPELRAPSIVGELRYWLRAALGGVLGDNLDALKKAEAEVFGDTNGTGAVSVRVRWDSSKEIPKPIEEKTLLHPSAKNPVKMWGFPAKSQFQLILTWHTDNNELWLITISALLLMVNIGGIGRRCRRGWGTVRIVEVEGVSEQWKNILKSPIKWEKLLDFVHKQSSNFCQKLNLKMYGSDTPLKYTTVSRNHLTVFKNENWEIYKKAISDFGENEHHWLQDNPDLVQSIGFAGPGKKRQASPFWLRLLPKQSGGYDMFAILFDIDFNGNKYEAVKKFLTDHANFKKILL